METAQPMELYSVAMEENVLGAMMVDPTMPDLVFAILQPGDFFIEKNRWVFEAMLSLRARSMPIEYGTVCEEMKVRGKLDGAGGVATVAHLLNVCEYAMAAEGFARIVEGYARRRALRDVANDILKLSYNTQAGDLDQLESDALKLLTVRLRSNGKMMSARQVAGELLDMVDAWSNSPLGPGQVRGLSTGYRALDLSLGGLERDTLTILAGRPGMGKSALGFSIAANVARAGHRVAVFSLEMSRRQVLSRLACARARINWLAVRQGLDDEGLGRIYKHIGDLSELPMSISDQTGLTTAQARAQIARLAAEGQLDLVVLDHIGLLADKDENEVRRIGAVTWELKRIAKDFGVPVIALCQLNRGVESRDEKRPTLSDLRDSGRIEENADIVLMLYRESYYTRSNNHSVEVLIRKNRDGEANVKAELFFDEKFALFADLANVEHEEAL